MGKPNETEKQAEIRLKVKEKWADFRLRWENINAVVAVRIEQRMFTHEDMAMVEQLAPAMDKMEALLAVVITTLVKRGDLVIPKPRVFGYTGDGNENLPVSKGIEVAD
jgi:hypothetical protein